MSREDPAIAFRLPPHELATIRAAVDASGLPPHVWYRIMLLAAAGNAELAAQLRRSHRTGERERQ